MEHVLTDAGLRMTYLRDAAAIAELDQIQILDDLTDGVSADEIRLAPTQPLTDYNHLVIAAERNSGRILGLAAAMDAHTDKEEFLSVEALLVGAQARKAHVITRMLALAVLRIAGNGPAPQIIASRVFHPEIFRSLRDMAQRFAGGRFYPDLDAPAVDLPRAVLARRIANVIAPGLRFDTAKGMLRGGLRTTPPPALRRVSNDPHIDAVFVEAMQPADQMLAVLDLRDADETTILDDARLIYRRG